jgi:hypothetical protein
VIVTSHFHVINWGVFDVLDQRVAMISQEDRDRANYRKLKTLSPSAAPRYVEQLLMTNYIVNYEGLY